jgi:hypothetical protein
MDDDYFSFEESSESDEDSFELRDEDKRNFSKIHQNNQILTLRTLRQTLRQNKSLKHRLNILESELDRYQNFGSFSPLMGDMGKKKSQSSGIDRDNSDLEFADMITKENIDEKLEEISNLDIETHKKITHDQYCQFDMDLIRENTVLKQEKVDELTFLIKKSQTPDIKIIEKIVEKYVEHPKPLTSNVECQTDEYIQDSSKLLEFNKKIKNLEISHKSEVEKLQQHINEANKKSEETSGSLNVLQASYDLIALKLADSNRNVMKLTDENQSMKNLKQDLQQSQVLNEQIYQDLQMKESELETKRKHLAEMVQKFEICNKTIEEHNQLIQKLQLDNEKHIKEKHLICKQKISELESENEQLKDRIAELEVAKEKQAENIDNLTKQVERYKIEQQNFNFKEFVSLKRELNSLKQEKERHFASVVTTPKNSDVSSSPTNPLPPIKESKKNLFKFFQ